MAFDSRPSSAHTPTTFLAPNELIKTNVGLKDKNWFRTGGEAKFFCSPQTAQEFQDALTFAQTHTIDIFVLGEGANVLISDEGFDGLVIQPQLHAITITNLDANNVRVTAGAGVRMHDLIVYCLERDILGLEEFSGIPGTVGGSVYINLHYFAFLLEHFLVSAHIMHKKTGTIENVDASWFNFGYNQSTLQQQKHYLLDATFNLTCATDLQTAYAQGRRTEIIRHRTARYPNSYTCGSFFRNFRDDEVTLISNGKKMIYVAYYLDKIGIKGNLRVGDATVSYQHANMIVNCGNATSADIIKLVRTMQERVREQFNVLPQPECLLVGFKEYPLHQ